MNSNVNLFRYQQIQTIKKDRFSLLLLKISVAIFLTYSFLGHIATFSAVLKVSTIFAIILLIFNFFIQFDKFKANEHLIYFGLMLFSLVHSFFSNNFGFFKLILFAGSARKLNFKSIVRFDMYLRAILVFFVSILCVSGIIPDKVYMYEGIVRRSMGFSNPNALGIAVFVLICDILYVNEFVVNLKTIIIIGLLATWLFVVAHCRTATYIIIGFSVIVLLYNFIPQIFSTEFIKFLLYLSPIILGVLTMITVSQFINGVEWAVHINKVLSGRVNSIANFVISLKPTIFGQPINETINKTLDNFYAFIIYDLGLAVSLIFVIAFFKMIRKNFYINTKLCLIMFGFLIYGLSEHLWINVDYNIFMLAFCANPMFEIKVQNLRKDKVKL